MEFSSFAGGTERAVKTWQVCCELYFINREDSNYTRFGCGKIQMIHVSLLFEQASSDVREDGIMTSELLEKLYTVQKIDTVKENPKQPDGTEAKVCYPFRHIDRCQY